MFWEETIVSHAILCLLLIFVTKVVQIIKCTQTVFVDNFRNISTDSLIQVSVCRGNYGGYVKHKRNDPMCDPWDSQGDKKCSFYFYCYTVTWSSAV